MSSDASSLQRLSAAPRLLLIDDSASDRATLRRFLAQAETPYEISEASDAREALELCRQQPFDLVITDFLMPDADGLELLEKLLEAPVTRRPKVIMTSGSGNERVAVEAMRRGAYDYLPKHGLSAPLLQRSVSRALKMNQVEAVLRESEQRFSSLADAAPVLIWLADEDGNAEFLNEGWLEFCGGHLEDMLGSRWLEFVHPQDLESFLMRYREALEGAQRFSLEFRLKHHSGAYRWVSCNAKPRYDASGRLQGFAGSCVDIHLQKELQAQTEQALAESEESYRLLFSSMASGVLHTDHQGVIIDNNPAAARILGVSRYGLIGQSIFDGAWQQRDEQGEPLAQAQLPSARAMASGQAEEGFINVRREDGRRIWLLSNAVAFKRPGTQEVQGSIVSFIDVTQLKEATFALERSEQRYRAIFNAQLSAILSTDARGKITSLNPAARRLFGYREDELLGRNLWILLDSAVDFTALLERVDSQNGAGTHFEELTFQRKSGERFPAEAVVSPLSDEGVGLGYIYVLRDISLQRQAESKLAETNRRLLHGRDDERRRLARDLHDGTVQDLVALGYELASLERELEQREEGLSREELLASLSEWRGHISTTIRQLRGVISNLRPAGLEEFGLEVVLESYLDALRRSSDLPEIRLERDAPLNDLPLAVSLGLLRTIQEALSNVLKHAEARRVTIRLRRLEREVSLSVEDDGKGFALPAELSELAQQQHFGLVGLSERAELMGGTLMVNSQPGTGTEVFLSLPLNVKERVGA